MVSAVFKELSTNAWKSFTREAIPALNTKGHSSSQYNGALKLPLTPLLGRIANVTKILQLLCSKQEDMKIKFIRKATQVNALNCVTAVAA